MTDAWVLERGTAGYPTQPARPRRAAATGSPEQLLGRGQPALIAGLDPGRAVTIVGARRSTAYGRAIARRSSRLARRGRAGRGQRDGLRDRPGGPPGCAGGRRRNARGPRMRPRPRLPAQRPRALPADPGRGRRGGLGGSRRATAPFRWDFPEAQPDHGRAGGDDRGGRGARALGLAHHRRCGARARPRRRRHARTGLLAALRGPTRPDPRRAPAHPRRPGRPRRLARRGRRSPPDADRAGARRRVRTGAGRRVGSGATPRRASPRVAALDAARGRRRPRPAGAAGLRRARRRGRYAQDGPECRRDVP